MHERHVGQGLSEQRLALGAPVIGDADGVNGGRQPEGSEDA
jgi:hypothetical protein